MNFLKSILSDDENNGNGVDDGWSFGDMIKTLAIQSETVIEIYRKDLEEFGSGLRKETELLRESATRAVKESLKSTANIISEEPGADSVRYSRFEAQVSKIQSDLDTFCVEPEDGEDYEKWKLGFELENYSDEIERLVGILGGVYEQVVPGVVGGETFWCRYFYRVEKLKQKESFRASLVRRAISLDDDELSSWDVDDDDEEDANVVNVASELNRVVDDSKQEEKVSLDNVVKSDDVSKQEEKVSLDDVVESNRVEEVSKRGEKVGCEEDSNDEKGEFGGKSDTKVVAEEEEELRWDEIEDTGSGGGRRISAVDHGGDDDEDLNWDLEDDDEPVKA